MKRSLKKSVMLAFSVIIIAVTATVFFSVSAEESGKWIGAWGTGITEVGVGGYNDIGVILEDVTCRSIITPTISGSKIRLRLSNIYGTTDLQINRMTVAKSVDGSQKIDTKTIKSVYFNGTNRDFVVPAGEELYSDPIDFDVVAMEPIAVSTFISKANEIRTCGFSGGTSVVAVPLVNGGNHTTSETLGTSIKMKYGLISVVPILSGVDVYSEVPDAFSVVVIGDSTVANDFPYYLAKQIYDSGYNGVGVVGKGIIGNSLLSDGFGIGEKIYGDSLIKRFNIDALSQAGVKYVVVKIGCNDIIHPKSGDNAEKYGAKQPTVDEMIAGYTQLAQMCHRAGIKIVCVCIMQWKGYTRDFFGTGAKYIFDENDWNIATRINEWMTTTNVFDHVVNLNSYSQDKSDPLAISSEYTADGAHPNTSLQMLWADKFPLNYIGVYVKPLGVKLNKAVVNLASNANEKLVATVSPSNAVDKSVVWSSSDESVATVNSYGVVTGVSEGTAVITCKTVSGLDVKARCIILVYTPASGVMLSKNEISMYETQGYTLKATVVPDNAKNKNVVWTSSNSAVATVSSLGRVTAKSAGTAVITCRTEEGSYTDTCIVKVETRIPVTKVILADSSKTVLKGYEAQLSASVYPSNASVQTVKWTSSDAAIATVSSTGVVTGIRGGTVTITCTSTDSGIYATCRVVVRSFAQSVSLNRNSMLLYTGGKGTLVSNVYPEDATVKNVTWSSDNNAVATVSSAGVVTARAVGTAVITCTTKDFGFTDKCLVTVRNFVKTTGVRLNVTAKNIYDSNSYRLTPTVYPSNASNKNVKWVSSDPTVAVVSSAGVVTGKSVGTCVITCTTVNGLKTASCNIRVFAYPASGVTLNRATMTLEDGRRASIVATVTPEKATNKNVRWSTSNSKIATVSATGIVTAQYPGTCKITATTVSGGYMATCTVKVIPVFVTGVTLNRTSLTVGAGSTANLLASVAPSNATNKNVRWQSGNTAVAKVSSTGVVTGVGAGKTLIACTTSDGGKLALCVVTVNSIDALGVKLNTTFVNIGVGKTYRLTGTVVPSNATNKSLKWSSSDSSIAKVSSTGVVTSVKKGTCYITAMTSNGFRTKCKVVVS